MFFADFSVNLCQPIELSEDQWKAPGEFTYLIEGGAPAGISILPVDEGCRTTRTSIKIITIHGNRSTAPRGIDIFELPFRRIRRRKNANLGVIRSLWRDTSSIEGRLGEDGIRFTKF